MIGVWLLYSANGVTNRQVAVVTIFSKIPFLWHLGAILWHLLVIPLIHLIRCHALRNRTFDLEASGLIPRKIILGANPILWRYLNNSMR